MYLCHLYPDELTDLLGFDSKDLTLDRLETMLEEQIPLTGDSLVDIDWRPDHDDPSTGFFVVSINPGYL